MSLDVHHKEMVVRPPEARGWEFHMLPPCSPDHPPFLLSHPHLSLFLRLSLESEGAAPHVTALSLSSSLPILSFIFLPYSVSPSP